MNSSFVAIVILNWNGWQDTAECVESCRRQSYADSFIVIVDNGSTDGSEAILRERFPDVDFIQTGANLGFAGGNNAGIRHALERGAGFVWLLNNDTIVDTEALAELVRAVRANRQCGIVGSKIFYYDDPEILWFAGGKVRSLTAASDHIGIAQKDCGQFDRMVDVDYVSGCSLLITREAIEAAGLMDERFFLLFEETDWNKRVLRLGFKVLYVPGSKVWHKISRSLGANSTRYTYYLVRNSLLFTLKHNVWFLPLVLLARVKDIVASLLKGRYECARFGLRGISDFFCGRFGQLR